MRFFRKRDPEPTLEQLRALHASLGASSLKHQERLAEIQRWKAEMDEKYRAYVATLIIPINAEPY